MTYDIKRKEFTGEHVFIYELDLDYCSETYGIGDCEAGAHEVSVDIVTVDDFAIGATITGNTSGATGTITNISGTSPAYTFTYTKTSGFDFVNDETFLCCWRWRRLRDSGNEKSGAKTCCWPAVGQSDGLAIKV